MKPSCAHWCWLGSVGRVLTLLSVAHVFFRRSCPGGRTTFVCARSLAVSWSTPGCFIFDAERMNRNMMRRVEVSWPVTDPDLRQRIVDECLVAYLHDDRDAWELQPGGGYVRAGKPVNVTGVQNALMGRYAPSGQKG